MEAYVLPQSISFEPLAVFGIAYLVFALIVFFTSDRDPKVFRDCAALAVAEEVRLAACDLHSLHVE